MKLFEWSYDDFLKALSEQGHKHQSDSYAYIGDSLKGAKAIANDILDTDDPYIVLEIFKLVESKKYSLENFGSD